MAKMFHGSKITPIAKVGRSLTPDHVPFNNNVIAIPTPRPDPVVQYVDREVRVIEYVDKIVDRVEYKEVPVHVPYETIKVVEKIVDREVPGPVRETRVEVPVIVKEVDVIEKIVEVDKVPVWAIIALAIQLATIAVLILQHH
jgi:hypothetical protein